MSVRPYRRSATAAAYRLSTIVHADLIIVLDSGVIVERGTHDELVKKPKGVYAGMWGKRRRWPGWTVRPRQPPWREQR